jgi:hypothetical protein
VLHLDDDPYAQLERRSVQLTDGTSVAYMTEKGVHIMRQCLNGVLYVLGKKLSVAYDARWVRKTSMLRLVSKEFAMGVEWYATQEPVTRRLRDFRSGRQRTLGEFFDTPAATAFQGWIDPAVFEAMRPTQEARRREGAPTVSALRMGKSKPYVTMETADDAMVAEFAIMQMDPGNAPVAVAAQLKCENRFDVLAPRAVPEEAWSSKSSGNAELDAREQLDTEELYARLKMATEARAKRVCHQTTPVRQVWDMRAVGKVTLAEEFEAQESDSSDESSDEAVPDLEEVVMDDDSDGDSEYWAAVEDSDLSDASVRTNDEEEGSSGSDFH